MKELIITYLPIKKLPQSPKNWPVGNSSCSSGVRDLALSQICAGADHHFLLAEPHQINHHKSTTASNPSCIGLNILLIVLYHPINFFLQSLHGYSAQCLTQ